MFRDKSEVVAEGKIIEENGQPVLIADNLMAKCPKYEGAPEVSRSETDRSMAGEPSHQGRDRVGGLGTGMN